MMKYAFEDFDDLIANIGKVTAVFYEIASCAPLDGAWLGNAECFEAPNEILVNAELRE